MRKPVMQIGFIFLLYSFLLAACSAQDNTAPLAGHTQGAEETTISFLTKEKMYDFTPTVTFTPSITLTPTITPTPTPAPGLEFFNAAYDGVSIAGELRNNTGQTMVMITSDLESEFKFFFDYYEDQSVTWSDGTIEIRVAHYSWGPVLLKAEGQSDYEVMNCILYPGETGAIVFLAHGYGIKPEGYYRNSEILTTMPPQLGLFYQYESRYISDLDLENIFHPQAESISFRIENHRIYFEFDVDIPFAEQIDLRKQRVEIPAWVKVYNAQGQLMDIINKAMELGDYLEVGKRNHIYGFTRLKGDPTAEDYNDREHVWRNHIDIEEEDEQFISRIEVFIEFRWDPTVRQSPCWETYRKR